jgi:hypothetical protein
LLLFRLLLIFGKNEFKISSAFKRKQELKDAKTIGK